jgi:hypothetical protein
VDRHAAPAGADFQQVIIGGELELTADLVQLGNGGLLQGDLGLSNSADEYIMVGSRNRRKKSLPRS